MYCKKTTLLGISLALISSAAIGAPSVRRTYATFSNPAELSQMTGDDKNAAQLDTTADQKLKLSLYVSPINTSATGTATSHYPPIPKTYIRPGHVSGKVTYTLPQGSYTQRINKKWVVGLEIGNSFYGHSRYPASNDFSTSPGLKFPVETKLQVLNISPEASYRINKMLVVGAGLDVSRASLKITETLGYPDPHTFDPAGYVTTKANLDDWGVGYHFGIVAHPWLGGYLGLSYYSKIKFTLKGTSTITGDPKGNPAPRNDTKLDLTTPDSLNANIFQALTPQFGLNFGIHYVHWSVIKHLNAENLPGGHTLDKTLNYSNTWSYSLGVRYQVIEPLVLSAGASYNTSPDNPAHTNPHSVQNKHYWDAGINAAYQFNKTFNVALGYAHEFTKTHTINNAKFNGEVHGSANQFSGTLTTTF